MRELIRTILHALEHGRSVELVGVVEASGSTPRGAGAMLALFPNGTTIGTVGGGNVEFEATNLAKELLAEGKDALRRFRFVQGDAASLGMVCGGDVTIHFQYLPAGDETVISLFREWLAAMEENTNVWFVRKLEEETVVSAALVTRERLQRFPHIGEAYLRHEPMFREGWISIPVVKAGRVYLFGGGHVSRALVPVIAAVGFRPVVYDDRPEFADLALFPQAVGAIHGSFEELSKYITVTADDYVVIMTRGHQADYEVLTQVLRSGAKYIGCIGSRRKLALCREKLLEAGFTAEEYARVHAPIGLAIGAETPEEIAVSVAAEMIAVRAGLNL